VSALGMDGGRSGGRISREQEPTYKGGIIRAHRGLNMDFGYWTLPLTVGGPLPNAFKSVVMVY